MNRIKQNCYFGVDYPSNSQESSIVVLELPWSTAESTEAEWSAGLAEMGGAGGALFSLATSCGGEPMGDVWGE